MKLDEMKVTYDRKRDGFQNVSDFTVDENKEPTVKSGSMVIKIGLCGLVLAAAIVIRAVGVEPQKEVVAAAAQAQSEDDDESVGALHYVDATENVREKWQAPVSSNDIELLLDDQLVRLTATTEPVCSCIDGTVLMVETDERYGTYVRVQGENGLETICYGLADVTAVAGATVTAGETLGTVPVGRSVYVAVLLDGAPQNPTDYIDLSLRA